MSAWPIVRLGDYCTVQNGFAFDSARFSEASGTPLIRIRDLKTDAPSVRFDGPSDPRYIVQRGDLLIGMDGEFVAYEWQGPPSLLNQRVCRLLTRGDRVDLAFLRYAIGSHLKTIEDHTSQTTVKHLSSRTVQEIRVPLPPLDEQRRIAARLRDELGAVADFGPSIERTASTLATLRRSALSTIFEQLLGERRSVGKLADVIKLRNDIVHPKDRPTGTAVFVGLEHIGAGSGRRIGQVPIDLAAMTGRKATFSPGNIVYGYLRPYLNKVWLADIDGFCSVDQYVLEVDARRADSDFMALFMLSDAYLSRAPITTTPGQLPRIRSGEVLCVPAPIPSLADQRRIAARLREQLAEIDRAKAALDGQRKAVDALPAALLREVFGNAVA